jgi:FkbM family methyltransferase
VPLSMEKHGYALQIRVSGDPGGDARPRLDKNTVEWIRERVGIGEVMYDLDAGLGMYAVLAARYHGAVVVAFEPGYAAYNDLCDNVRVNGCDGSVLSLPLAVADWNGLGELKFPTGMAGQSKHTLRASDWRIRRASGDEGTVRQTVCTLTLDEAIHRYGLPSPHHLRFGGSAATASVLSGDTAVLALDTLKTIFFTLPVEEAEATAARLAPRQWTVARHIPISRGRAHVQLSREPVAASQVGSGHQ